jgi:hypothetical protein
LYRAAARIGALGRERHMEPKAGEFRAQRTLDFGEPIDLTGTVVDLTLPTADFPRD